MKQAHENTRILKHKTALGRGGEDIIAVALRNQGWKIVAKNYAGIGFELDLIVSKGRTLVIVEVKVRSSPPEDCFARHFLGNRKRRALRRGINFLLGTQLASSLGVDSHRFDLALLIKKPIKKKSPLSADMLGDSGKYAIFYYSGVEL